MTPFEFLTVFFSFAYALAFSHVLLAAAEMIRHRRVLVFSWPHALWMANAVMLLFSNWISLYDFRSMEVMSLGTILTLFVFVTTLYFTCALVTPDFDAGTVTTCARSTSGSPARTLALFWRSTS